MGVSVSSGNTSVTGNVSVTTNTTLPIPSATQTLVTITGTGNGSNQNAYTVTAGKTFYLFGYAQSNGAASTEVFKADGTTRIGFIATSATTTSQAVCSSVPIWNYAATTNVVVKTTTGTPYFLWGVEV